jgi:hypothetical protein
VDAPPYHSVLPSLCVYLGNKSKSWYEKQKFFPETDWENQIFVTGSENLNKNMEMNSNIYNQKLPFSSPYTQYISSSPSLIINDTSDELVSCTKNNKSSEVYNPLLFSFIPHYISPISGTNNKSSSVSIQKSILSNYSCCSIYLFAFSNSKSLLKSSGIFIKSIVKNTYNSPLLVKISEAISSNFISSGNTFQMFSTPKKLKTLESVNASLSAPYKKRMENFSTSYHLSSLEYISNSSKHNYPYKSFDLKNSNTVKNSDIISLHRNSLSLFPLTPTPILPNENLIKLTANPQPLFKNDMISKSQQIIYPISTFVSPHLKHIKYTSKISANSSSLDITENEKFFFFIGLLIVFLICLAFLLRENQYPMNLIILEKQIVTNSFL